MMLGVETPGAPVRDRLFSVLTTVYQNTKTEYFRITVDSLLKQTHPFFEWIILAHGPISPDLDAELRILSEADSRLRVLRRPVNLGIVGGMAVCLAEAAGDYIVPMDADDVLVDGALATLAAAIGSNARPAMLYSDEDILVGTECGDAYRRPDWDEVLNLASSYVWHLCAIRRDAALTAGLYTSADAEWCHDWDTVFRIATAEAEPVHVPLVLYHWRHHPASSTNRPDPDSGSRRSTHALLEGVIRRQSHPQHFEVADFPLFRGAPEWSIRRKPVDPPRVLGISLKGGPRPWRGPLSRTIVLGSEMPKRSIWQSLFGDRDPGQRGASPTSLAQALAAADEPFVALCGGAFPADDEWFYEAVGLLELHDKVLSVHGPIVDGSDRVLRGAEIFAHDGSLLCPLLGKPYRDAGPFALMHKPHCVAVAPTDFLVCRTEALRHELQQSDSWTSLAGLGLRLGWQALQSGLAMAYSPLVKAVAVSRSDLVDGDANDAPMLAERILDVAERREMGRPIRGAAGFVDPDRYLDRR